MAKIAVEFTQTETTSFLDDASGRMSSRLVARGDGWTVSDVVCHAGPRDRPYEEQHSVFSIAVVIGGSFQYRSTAGREILTPGSLFLGNAGEYYECGHEHGVGDRCLAFSYEPEYFECLAAEAGHRNPRFLNLRVPPVRELSTVIARASAGLAKLGCTKPPAKRPGFDSERQSRPESYLRFPSPAPAHWEEIAVELAARALVLAGGHEPKSESLPAAEARVTRTVRMIESRPDSEHSLGALAQEAKLSRYHFLRVFQQLIGLTPHQYVLRNRLRRAATRLMVEPARVLDIALDSGFGDVSNFNHAFRAEFGVNPTSYRRLRSQHAARKGHSGQPFPQSCF